MKSKRFICILLSLSIIFSSCAVSVFAKESNKSRSDAMLWARSQVGQSIDFDKANGAQCVDLIMAYYNFLGEPRGIGNAVDYVMNKIPDDWQRIKGAVPKKGDILIYAGDPDFSYGHLGIYESNSSSYHQAKGVVYNTSKSYNQITSSRGAPYWGVIRPAFSDDVKIEDSTSTTVPSLPSSGGGFVVDTTEAPSETTSVESTSSVTVSKVQLEKSSIKSVKKLGGNKIKISWKNACSESQSYQVQYSTNKKFKSKYTKSKTVSNKNSCKISKLKSNKKYYVRVRAYKKTTNEVSYSGWSKVKTVKM